MFKFFRHLFGRRKTSQIPYVPDDLSQHEVSQEERRDLENWAKDPTTKLALALASVRKPPAIFPHSGTNVSGEQDNQAAVNRLHQIQGWDLAYMALRTIHIPPEKIQELREKYSNPEEKE